MASKTIVNALAPYRIGPKVRALRTHKKLGLVQLGAHTELSPGMLSKIERGQVIPTLPTLLRIAMVFDVGLDHFFSDADGGRALAVVRRGERVRLPDRPGGGRAAYHFESLDFPVNNRRIHAYHAEFPRDARASDPHAHDGEELVYVLAGTLVVSVNGKDVTLEEGDALYFDSGVPHRYRGAGRATTRAMVVVTA